MKQAAQKLFNNETFVATLLILLTTVITYGISIPKLGYYHDDWFVLWSGQMRGADSLIPLFSTDRPFMGVIYSVLYRVLGNGDRQLASVCAVVAFHRCNGIFLDPAHPMAGSKIPRYADDSPFHRLSGVPVAA